MKYLRNKKGEITQLIIVLIAFSSVAGYIMPKVYKAMNERQTSTINIYNGEDTVTNY